MLKTHKFPEDLTDMARCYTCLIARRITSFIPRIAGQVIDCICTEPTPTIRHLAAVTLMHKQGTRLALGTFSLVLP